MGRDLYEKYGSARDLFERADGVLGRKLSALCFEGPADEANSQPAIYVTSLACLAAAREAGAVTQDAAFVAGHSLGEYTALAAAGAVEFAAGLSLVEERGRLTTAAAEARRGSMAALLGIDEEAAQAACDEAGAEVCNFNAPGQIVVGGDTDAVERACKLARERGAKRAILLDVSGAFHTSLMHPAAEPFAQAVSSAGIRAPRIPFVANNTGIATVDAAEIAGELVYQLTHPVRWVQCVEHLGASGVSSVIEFGPGRVLTGLIKRIAPGMAVRNINSAASIEK